jgi:hypothetical protein
MPHLKLPAIGLISVLFLVVQQKANQEILPLPKLHRPLNPPFLQIRSTEP